MKTTRQVRKARRAAKEQQRSQNLAWLKELGLVSQLGITMVVSIAVFFVGGYFLDKWLGTKPIFSLIFIILGVAGGGFTVYKQIMDTIRPKP